MLHFVKTLYPVSTDCIVVKFDKKGAWFIVTFHRYQKRKVLISEKINFRYFDLFTVKFLKIHKVIK